MSKPKAKHLNIALTQEEYEQALAAKEELGVPHWRDVVLLGGAAIKFAREQGQTPRLIRETFSDRADAARVAGGIEAARILRA